MLMTDRRLLSPMWTLAQCVAPTVTGGVNLVVFCETDLPVSPRLTVARFVRDGVGGRAPYLLAGDPAFAMKAGAEGAHLEDEERSVAEARAQLGPNRLLGATVQTLDGAQRAEAEGADYLLVYLDWARPDEALSILRVYCEAVSIPVIAGLDMSVEQAAACRAAGAAGVAICAPGMAAYDRTAAARAYRAALDLTPYPLS